MTHALAVAAWQRVQEQDFVEQNGRRAGTADVHPPAVLTPPAGEGGLPNDWLRVARLSGTGSVLLPGAARMLGITVLKGQVRLGATSASRGRSMVVPACLGAATLELSEAHAIVSSVA